MSEPVTEVVFVARSIWKVFGGPPRGATGVESLENLVDGRGSRTSRGRGRSQDRRGRGVRRGRNPSDAPTGGGAWPDLPGFGRRGGARVPESPRTGAVRTRSARKKFGGRTRRAVAAVHLAIPSITWAFGRGGAVAAVGVGTNSGGGGRRRDMIRPPVKPSGPRFPHPLGRGARA